MGFHSSLGDVEPSGDFLVRHAGDDESRAGSSASSGTAHEPYIDLLIELHRLRPLDGFSGADFEAGERARARRLLALGAGSGMRVREAPLPLARCIRK